MSKYKINPGFASVILLGTLFTNWATMLTVLALLLIFCDIDDKVKGIMIKIVAFYVGLTIITYAWDLIVDAVNLVINSITNLVKLINSYLEYNNAIDISKLESYLFTPITLVVKIANDIVSYLFTFIKLGFIIAILDNKNIKENAIVKKINDYVEKVINFVNNMSVINTPTADNTVNPVAGTDMPMPK